MTRTVQDYEAAVASAKLAYEFALRELEEFNRSPENFRFVDLDEATDLEWELLDRAGDDCEGSHNFGDDEYRQEFYVNEKKYVAIIHDIFYNRHDKRYYYVDGHKFRIEEVNE